MKKIYAILVFVCFTTFSWAQFTIDRVVVLRVGNGEAALSNASTPVFLEEYSKTGMKTFQLALPIQNTANQRAFTVQGSSTAEGQLTLSANKKFLVIAGYDTIPGVASISGTASTLVKRKLVVVNKQAEINSQTVFTDAYSGGNIRGGVINDDKSMVWTAGTSGGTNNGVRTAPFGVTGSSVRLNSELTNIRTVHIFDGELYVTAQSGSFRIAKVGSQIPTTEGAAIVNLPGTPNATISPYGLIMFDTNESIPGVDLFYYADDRAVASGGGIYKFAFDGTNWIAKGSYNNPARGLTGEIIDGKPRLYITTSPSSANHLVAFTDNAVATADIMAANIDTLGQAPANTAFRGVALSPEVDDSPITSVNFKESNQKLFIKYINEQIFAEYHSLRSGNATLEIIDITGKVISTESIRLESGQNIIPIGSSILVSGVNFIVIKNGDERFVRKIIQ